MNRRQREEASVALRSTGLLVINLKTAEALSLTIPPPVLMEADAVIR